MNNFRKIIEVDVTRLLRQVEIFPELWNQHTLRTTHPGTVHGQASDIWLRFNDLKKYNSDNYPMMMDDLECVNYPALFSLPEAALIINTLKLGLGAKKAGRVIITKLPPLGMIRPHIDQGKYAEHYDRYQVALQSNPGITFQCGDEVVDMRPGEVWWFDTSKEHQVINASNQDRITLIVDLK